MYVQHFEVLEYGQIFRSPFHKKATWKFGIFLGLKILNLSFGLEFFSPNFEMCFTIQGVCVFHCTVMFNYEIYKQILWRVR